MSGPRRAVALIRVLTLGALIVLPSIVMSQGEEKPWGPYLKTRKGEVKPLPGKIERMKDADWLRIAYTDYSGIKPRVAVVLPPVREDNISAKDMNSDVGRLLVLYSRRTEKQPDGSENPEIQLRQALGATNRFRMIEGSSTVGDILNEHDFGQSGRVSDGSASKLKRISGAQYIARVSIIEIKPEKESKSITVVGGALTGSTLALGSVGAKGKVAYVCVNAKIVNTETGDIVSDLTATGTSKGGGSSFGGGFLKGVSRGMVGAGGIINTETATSLGEAIQACVNKIAYLTASKVDDLPLTLTVLHADAKSLSIEGGRDVGLEPGMFLRLESKLEPITNAVGDTLDWNRADNGQVKVTRVLPSVSTCEYVNGGGAGTKKGDLATFEPKIKK